MTAGGVVVFPPKLNRAAGTAPAPVAKAAVVAARDGEKQGVCSTLPITISSFAIFTFDDDSGRFGSFVNKDTHFDMEHKAAL